MKIQPFQTRPPMPQGMMGMRPGMMKNYRPGMPPNFQQHPSRVAEWVQEQEAHMQDPNFHMGGGGGGINPRMPSNNMRMMNPWPSGGPGPNQQGFHGNSNFPMFPDGYEQEMMFHSQNPNLSHHKVPDENLTPEQLKKREESLTNLRKIQQMLFPEQRGGGQGFGPMPGQGPGPGGPGGPMMPNEMMMQQNMMPPEGMMGNQPGMMGPEGMMPSSQGPMPGGPPNMMMSHMRGPGPQGMGPGPQNMQNMTPAQREWLRLQQEYYMDKRRHQQQQLAQRMGHPNMEMGPGSGQPWQPGPQPPPPSYSSTISQKRHGSVGSLSTSPNNNGPIGSPIPGFDPTDPLGGVFPPRQQKSPFGMNHPDFGGMNMGGPHGGPPGNFEQSFGPHGGPMHPGMGPMVNRKNSQVTIQRAGNPEQFIPELAISTSPLSGSSNKPPPSYAQSQKRKRVDLEEELYKNLQPTPSPQQINYNLNQFEGQELTITKQLNAAYREPIPPNDQSQNHSSQNQIPHSPMHGPGSNRGPMSNSSQTSSGGPLSSPGPMPGQNPSFGASMRLSHYDPSPNPNMQPSNNCPPPHMAGSGGPHTPSSKSSSMSNITSASLANLAKGVEHLSNQMQQNMMQGGPFHSIQMQGQGQQGPNTNNSQTSAAVSNNVESSTQNQNTPSVNNTYVNATMSIQQLNIQSVNNPHGPGYNPSMSVQQMNMEQQQMNAMNNSGGPGPQGMPSSQGAQGMPGPQSMPASTVSSSSGVMSQPAPTGMGHSGMRNTSAQMGSSAPPQQNMIPGQSGRMSPNFSASSMGNANVQIQAKAPNTIQYLPAHPPANPQGQQPTNKRPDMDFMQRFAPPMGNIENKVPTSKMQYFPPGSQPGPGMESFGPGMPPGGPGGRCSPFSGPGGPMNPNMGPHPMQRGGNGGMPPDMHPSMAGGSSMNMMNPDMHNQEAIMMSNQMASMQGNMPPGPGGMMPEQMMGRNFGQMSAQGAMMSSHSGNMMRMEGMSSMAMSHPNSPPFPGSRENMMGMMQAGGPMPGRNFGPAGMDGMPGQGHGPPMGNPMGNYGPSMSRQGMRMPGPGNPNMPNMLPNGPGPGPGPGPNQGYNSQYEQFQQQLYSQGRSRQMSPMGGGMMPGPGGQPQYMNMMPNMP